MNLQKECYTNDLAIEKAKEFIEFLYTSTDEVLPKSIPIMFSLQDYGSLVLSHEEEIKYRAVLGKLISANTSDLISAKEIEKLFQKAILKSLDIEEKSETTNFYERLGESIKEFKKLIKSKPKKYFLYFPVEGLALNEKSLYVGKTNFCIFDNLVISEINSLRDAEEKDANQLILQNAVEKESIPIGSIIGKTEVDAVDIVAAKVLGLNELRNTLDVINFFGEFIPYHQGFAYLPGEKNRVLSNSVLTNHDTKNITISYEVSGPISPVPLDRIFEEDDKKSFGFKKISKVINSKRSDFEDIVLTSVLWAGKGIKESIKEKTFLMYAIALETLILPKNDHEELMYRLLTRVAHLISTGLENRKKVSQNIRDLYKTRSKIVHSGLYKITDAELHLLKTYLFNCLLRVINDEPFIKFNCIEDYELWFNEQDLI